MNRKNIPCNKSGIKIHETQNQSQPQHRPQYPPTHQPFSIQPMHPNPSLLPVHLRHPSLQTVKPIQFPQEKQYNKYYEQKYQEENRHIVSHPKIKPPFPQQTHQPSHQQQTQPSPLDNLNLNLDDYNLEDLYNLFKITDHHLTDETMKETRKRVLKLHPDKAPTLNPNIYEFFNKAYKRLEQIYSFQNKSEAAKKKQSTSYDESGFDDKEKNVILSQYFSKNGGFSNATFNEWFDKNKVEDESQNGYGDWLKSDDGIVKTDEKVTKGNMDSVFEKQKKALKAVVVYKGVSDDVYLSSGVGGSLLNVAEDNQNYTPSDIFSGGALAFTDLRQSYVESVIPVTEEDFEMMPKFKNVGDYKNHRESQQFEMQSKAEAEARLRELERKKGQEAASTAYYYARQAEKIEEKQNAFWSGLKQLTNF